MWPARYSPYDLAGSDQPPTWLALLVIVGVTVAAVGVTRDSRIGGYAGGTLLVGVGMIGMTIADASRWLLAGACIASAVTAVLLARVMVASFRLHLLFIALWSLIFAGGAMSLTTGYKPLAGALIAALNASAAAVVGGWAAISARVVIRSRRIDVGKLP